MTLTSRLTKRLPHDLEADQRALYTAIAGGPRAVEPQVFALTDADGALAGPFNAMLLSPGIGAPLQELGGAIRYRSALSDRAREIAILVVAHQWESDFELAAHEAVGRAAGLTAEELDALDNRENAPFVDETERLVLDTTRALASRGDLDDDEYAAASAGLGDPVLFELSTLVGYYATLALQLRLFRVTAEGLDVVALGE